MAQIPQVGDLQIYEDMAFQERDWRMQRIGWVIMAVVVAAALLGLFGGAGPLNTRTVGSEADLQIVYPPLLRVLSAATVSISVPVIEGEARVWLSQSYLDRVDLNAIQPEPERVEVDADRQLYRFAAPAAERVTIRFQIEPVEFGRLQGQAGVSGGSELSIDQWVYP